MTPTPPPSTFAVIITHNRPELLRRCVDAIASQVDCVIVVDNASEPPVDSTSWFVAPLGKSFVIRDETQPPNLPALWNRALMVIAGVRADHTDAHVAFLCDDAIAPAGWFATVSGAMIETGAAAGCVNPFGHQHEPMVKTEPDHDLLHRMVGWAFVLDVNRGIEPDETMHWWWCDTDIDWQARAAGGMVMLGRPDLVVPNERPNEFLMQKPELAEQAGKDGEAFAAKWNGRPW